MRLPGTLVPTVAALLVVGCGGGESDPADTGELRPPETTAEVSVDVVACDAAVAEAAQADQVDAEALRPAFGACVSLEDFSAAAAVSDVTGGQRPEEFVQQRCETEQALAESRLCQSL